MVTRHEFELAFGAEASELFYDAEDGLNGNGTVDNVAQWLLTKNAATYEILRARAAVKKAHDAAKLTEADYDNDAKIEAPKTIAKEITDALFGAADFDYDGTLPIKELINFSRIVGTSTTESPFFS